jgi:hypothetical protein
MPKISLRRVAMRQRLLSQIEVPPGIELSVVQQLKLPPVFAMPAQFSVNLSAIAAHRRQRFAGARLAGSNLGCSPSVDAVAAHTEILQRRDDSVGQYAEKA